MTTANKKSLNTAYSFNEHKHRFAVWTAARAVQRSFTTTKNIQSAINATRLREVAECTQPMSEELFDIFHRETCKQIIAFIDPITVCSYGRAAKIVAIYLKTSVILPSNGTSPLAELIHPPIDNILLTALAKKTGLEMLKTEKWTQFSEEDYWQVVERVRSVFQFFDWRLEAYWKPEREANKSQPILL